MKKKTTDSNASLQQQVEDWQKVYEREMKIVDEEGATQLYGDNEGMSPHLKAANLAQQNIIRLNKLLKDVGDDAEDSPLEKFLAS